jgi:hypothetical protein
MPGTLPATGSQISFGRVNQAFTNISPGTAGNAPTGGQNIKLSAVLGFDPIYTINQTAGTQISFSSTFGGKSYPYTY